MPKNTPKKAGKKKPKASRKRGRNETKETKEQPPAKKAKSSKEKKVPPPYVIMKGKEDLLKDPKLKYKRSLTLGITADPAAAVDPLLEKFPPEIAYTIASKIPTHSVFGKPQPADFKSIDQQRLDDWERHREQVSDYLYENGVLFGYVNPEEIKRSYAEHPTFSTERKGYPHYMMTDKDIYDLIGDKPPKTHFYHKPSFRKKAKNQVYYPDISIFS